MLANHDLCRAMDAVVLDAQVRDRSDGYKELWARFRVDEEQWVKFDQEAAGAPGGFSFSCSEPLAELPPLDSVPPVGLRLALAADASHWSDADLLAAGEMLQMLGSVNLERRYEFAHDPAAVVVLEMAGSLVLGVVGNAVYDALKRFVRRGKATVFHFHIEEVDRVVDARLETDDAEALDRAISSFDQLANPAKLFVWSDEERKWKRI